ncbi:MFS transporter (plasmid) [Streptomyces sp. CA-142005]|uniref:MFS transporter n=1 Tax=Streptomyces sp. CA-142005 TaxID=3240052 RepID=UPI003D90F04E
MALALFCVQLDYYSLNLALPSISHGFHVPASALRWVISGYELAAGTLLIPSGRVGDLLGQRRTLQLGTALFGLSSLFCALTNDVELLIIFRVTQGASAAMIMPSGVTLLTHTFPRERRAKAIGFALAAAGVGNAVGPFVGGTVTQMMGWRCVFLVNLPLAAAAVYLVTRVAEYHHRRPSPKIDFRGLASIVAAIGLTGGAVEQSSVSGWDSLETCGFLAGGILFVALFVAIELRVEAPLVDLRLFKNGQFTALAAAGAVASGACTLYLFQSTVYLQRACGLSPFITGLVFLIPAAAATVSGIVATRVVTRVPPLQGMAAALALGGMSLLLLSLSRTLPLYVVALGLCGGTLGMALRLPTMTTQAVVPRYRAGEASGVTLAGICVGGGLGLAFAGVSVPTSRMHSPGLNMPLLLGASVCLLTAGALVTGRALPGRLRRVLVHRSNRDGDQLTIPGPHAMHRTGAGRSTRTCTGRCSGSGGRRPGGRHVPPRSCASRGISRRCQAR